MNQRRWHSSCLPSLKQRSCVNLILEAGFARYPKLEPNSKSMMRTKLTLFVAVLAAILFGMGCASVETGGEPLKKGLVAYLPFNGNSIDESGNGNHGGVNGAVLTNDRHGNENSAYSFDGDDYIELGPMNFGDELTVSAWVNLAESSGRGNFVFSKYDGKDGGELPPYRRSVSLQLTNTLEVEWVISRDGTGLHAITSEEKNLILNRMYHVVCSYGGGKQTVYINGKLDNQHSAGKEAIFKSDVPVSIGANIGFVKTKENEPARRSVDHHFTGNIDDVRVYNRALSAEEVKALYDLEKPKGK
jgi:hypothetical protein